MTTEIPDWLQQALRVENPVTDHAYFGNLCAGFRGTTECKHIDVDTGRRCGREPYEHLPPRHRAETLDDGSDPDRWLYKGRHRA